MEEKKNNQVQALDGSTLDNVSGGWRRALCVRRRRYVNGDVYCLSAEEVKKLTDAGFTVFDTEEAGKYKISKGVQDIAGSSGDAILKNILG